MKHRRGALGPPGAPGALGPRAPGALGPWAQGPRAPGPWAPNSNAEEAPLHNYNHTLPLLIMKSTICYGYDLTRDDDDKDDDDAW